MNVRYDKSFSKWIGKLKTKAIKQKIAEFIDQAEKAQTIQDLQSVKKLKGDSISYRKRIGMYRLGFEFDNNTITFIIIAHRKDIYNYFP